MKKQQPSIKPTPLKSKLKAREVREAIRAVKAAREARALPCAPFR